MLTLYSFKPALQPQDVTLNNLNNLELLQTPSGDDTPASSGTMLTTMLLLIAGFTMSSVMMTHYFIPPDTAADNNATISFLSMAKFFNIRQPDNEQDSKDLNTIINQHDLMNHWPRLKLAGFGKSEEESGNFAIINGKKIHLGQYVAGKVKLVEIRDHDVIVEFKNERRILTIEN